MLRSSLASGDGSRALRNPCRLCSVPKRHRRAVQRLVRTLSRLQKSRQMQHESFEEFCVETHEAVELRAVRQGRESVPQVSLGIAVEVPLAGEPGPPGEDGEGDDLTCG